jgi:hypothetical protein
MDDQTTSRRTRFRTRYRNRGCGSGCASFFLVLTVGIVLSLFNAGIGVGVSVRIPFTSSNLTVAGSLGTKAKAVGALPDYVEGRLGGNQNFFNNSTTMTIGPAEGAVLVILGKQVGAPALDLHLELH